MTLDTPTRPITPFEVSRFILALQGSDEAKCESHHSEEGNLDCSVSVVARAYVCRRPSGFNVCQSYVDALERDTALYGDICGECFQDRTICGRIVPV
jgi:hypothetical protein